MQIYVKMRNDKKKPILSNIEIDKINQEYIIKYLNFDKENNFQNIRKLLTLCVLSNLKPYFKGKSNILLIDLPNLILQ